MYYSHDSDVSGMVYVDYDRPLTAVEERRGVRRPPRQRTQVAAADLSRPSDTNPSEAEIDWRRRNEPGWEPIVVPDDESTVTVSREEIDAAVARLDFTGEERDAAVANVMAAVNVDKADEAAIEAVPNLTKDDWDRADLDREGLAPVSEWGIESDENATRPGTTYDMQYYELADVPLDKVKVVSQSHIVREHAEALSRLPQSAFNDQFNEDDSTLVQMLPWGQMDEDGNAILTEGTHRLVAAHIRGDDTLRVRITGRWTRDDGLAADPDVSAADDAASERAAADADADLPPLTDDDLEPEDVTLARLRAEAAAVNAAEEPDASSMDGDDPDRVAFEEQRAGDEPSPEYDGLTIEQAATARENGITPEDWTPTTRATVPRSWVRRPTRTCCPTANCARWPGGWTSPPRSARTSTVPSRPG